MDEYQSEDWEFSERFIPEMCERICAVYKWGDPVIEVADHYRDYCENTDLILTLRRWNEQMAVAARVRRPKFIRYADEFTIRNFLGRNGYFYKDSNGCLVGDTEYQKIRAKYGNLNCYCISAQNEKELATFCLGSLYHLRAFIEAEAQDYHEWRDVVSKTTGDRGQVWATWKPHRQRIADRTGCGFLTYKKLEVPDFIIKDYKTGR